MSQVRNLLKNGVAVAFVALTNLGCWGLFLLVFGYPLIHSWVLPLFRFFATPGWLSELAGEWWEWSPFHPADLVFVWILLGLGGAGALISLCLFVLSRLEESPIHWRMGLERLKEPLYALLGVVLIVPVYYVLWVVLWIGIPLVLIVALGGALLLGLVYAVMGCLSLIERMGRPAEPTYHRFTEEEMPRLAKELDWWDKSGALRPRQPSHQSPPEEEASPESNSEPIYRELSEDECRDMAEEFRHLRESGTIKPITPEPEALPKKEPPEK